MKTYDAIVVLGTQPDPVTWQFPPHIYSALNTAHGLLKQAAAPRIILCGDHALLFDNIGITQPFKEADKMKDYLLERQCPPEAIITETVSKDTLANYYYLKNQILMPNGWTSLLQITVEYRIPRLKFLSRKVLGSGYAIDFQTVKFDDVKVIANEAFVFQKQREFLADMKDGDDAFLKDQFYDSAMYRFWKQREQAGSGS